MTTSTLIPALRTAADRRRKAGLPDAETDAFRLLHEHGDGLRGLIVDRYGPVGVIRLRHPEWWSVGRFEALAEALAEVFLGDVPASPGLAGFRVIVDERGKHTPRELADLEERLHAVLAERGLAATDAPAVFRENGFTFEATFSGFSQGLFLDMRPVRRDLHHRWRGRKVANLFAYTCGFGVVLAGRNRVVNVDTSRPALDHGRRHYALNTLPVRDEDFLQQDAFAFLDGCLADGRRWDAIILDPPVQSRGKRGVSRPFALRKDLGRLVEQAMDCLAPGGELFVSTNYDALEQVAFRRLMVGIARDRRKWLLEQWGPDVDHPVTAARHHLKTALLGDEPADAHGVVRPRGDDGGRVRGPGARPGGGSRGGRREGRGAGGRSRNPGRGRRR
ncbi:MAG: class I SAM-dependent rRNA methyltransferase [Deltaproteobacteria bacterium]|nr:MAG: class I SAM-dependent rRNA methyltransferase [Deltaproteobacteria bacterium]